MKTKALLEKLMDVERALQRGECYAAQKHLFDAQDCVLQIEREMIEMQAEKVRLSAPVPVKSALQRLFVPFDGD